ncbi:DinB family protein [Chryseosolibacter indicus]|uniref:DinB family protein n=1 Tax=Chryseosolibacter indicus TaxID=2782351 RepID=A0ABS5VXN6_9BACT|nr:DinB family protein [Chryseosolibacter indicus]MBT1705514.1 DinB family protein [Chryseosolibacter indicus]
MKKIQWSERTFTFKHSEGMLPFFIDRLEGSVVRLERRVSGIRENLLSATLEGKWSVKQNIGHLTEVDEVGLKRIDEIINGVSPMSPAVFELKVDYNTLSISKLLEDFALGRQRVLRALHSLGDTDLNKESMHPRLKVTMTPVDLAFFTAEHDDHHLVRINEIIAAGVNA